MMSSQKSNSEWWLQALVRRLGLVDTQWYLVRDANAVAFKGDDLFRMIGQNPNILQAQVDEDLRADAAFVLHHAQAGGFAVQLAALVKMNLRQHARLLGGVDTEATAGVMEIEENAAVFLGDCGQRARHQFAAIACRGTEDITGQAVRMDAHQCRSVPRQIA